MTAPIDIGPGATDRSSFLWGGYTFVDTNNSANDTGYISSFEVWFEAIHYSVDPNWATGVKIGTFSGSGTTYTSRDVESIGTVAKGSKQTFTGLNCDVVTGDFIGCYFDATSTIEWSDTGGTTVYYASGDQFGTGAQTYTENIGWGISLYGTGINPHATVLAATSAATGTGVAPTYSVTAQVTVTATLATATATSYNDVGAGSGMASIADASAPDVSGRFNRPSIRLEAAINIPIMECDGVGLVSSGTNTVDDIPVMAVTGDIIDHQFVKILAHWIYQGRYFDMPLKANRVYVVGSDTDGNLVFGSAINSTDITEHGEILMPITEIAIPTVSDANSVASNVLANARFSVNRGEITVPPNCGMEVGDVIQVTDAVANQSTDNYRVAGFKLVYDPTQTTTVFQHTIKLTSV